MEIGSIIAVLEAIIIFSAMGYYAKQIAKYRRLHKEQQDYLRQLAQKNDEWGLFIASNLHWQIAALKKSLDSQIEDLGLETIFSFPKNVSSIQSIDQVKLTLRDGDNTVDLTVKEFLSNPQDSLVAAVHKLKGEEIYEFGNDDEYGDCN